MRECSLKTFHDLEDLCIDLEAVEEFSIDYPRDPFISKLILSSLPDATEPTL
jgi:hypothetical protein